MPRTAPAIATLVPSGAVSVIAVILLRRTWRPSLIVLFSALAIITSFAVPVCD